MNKRAEIEKIYKLVSLVTLILGILAVANLFLIPTTIFITSIYPSGLRFMGIVLACWSTASFSGMFIVAYIIKFIMNHIFKFKVKDGLS